MLENSWFTDRISWFHENDGISYRPISTANVGVFLHIAHEVCSVFTEVSALCLWLSHLEGAAHNEYKALPIILTTKNTFTMMVIGADTVWAIHA